MTVIRATEVTKRWGATTALDRATFTIGDGITGLLGANGAGKTTLIGLVLGLHRPDGGTIEVLGRNPWTAGSEVRAKVGYAPEHDALPPDVRAHDLVRHLAEVHGLPRREATERANDVLYEVGLGEERFRPVGTMSTGQRQRVKLAQAIAHDPDIVLLDEPTNGLDPVQREQMLALIRRVGSVLDIDVVLSSHLLEEVERVSDQVLILDAGRVAGGGKMGELGEAATELDVEIAGTASQARDLVKRLAAVGAAATAEGRLVTVALESERVFDLVRDAVADGGIGIRRLERRTTSLEDVYLAADGGGTA
ncbi:MAG TPA: ABC transporter ATP-binding protein [Acidimicrobiales bacterium]|nr:ABC transporter ATP-binding protein [Acidimicrobiales bacterium]